MLYGITAVTVCVGFGDYLPYTFRNRAVLDRWVIVTSEEDTETRECCHQFGIECVIGRRIYGPHGFTKGAAVNEALERVCGDVVPPSRWHRLRRRVKPICPPDGWVLHLDADIILPLGFGERLGYNRLDDRLVYGFDRHDVVAARFRHYEQSSRYWREKRPWSVRMQDFPVGGRVVRPRDGGWVPIGFAQLWHPHGSGIGRYLENRTKDDPNTDVAFAAQWPRNRRTLIPEVVCAHLKSVVTGMGRDWNGRKTPRFDPTEARAELLELDDAYSG